MSRLLSPTGTKGPCPPLARLAVGPGTKAIYCPGPKGCRDKWPGTKVCFVVVFGSLDQGGIKPDRLFKKKRSAQPTFPWISINQKKIEEASDKGALPCPAARDAPCNRAPTRACTCRARPVTVRTVRPVQRRRRIQRKIPVGRAGEIKES